MPKIVRCPHCGAQNPYSLLITVCQQCKGDLSGLEPCDEPAEQETVQAAPPESLATARPEGAPAGPPSPAAAQTEAPSIVTTRTAGVDSTTQPVRPTEAGPEHEAPITGVDQPPAVPSASAAALGGHARSRVVCGRCGYTNLPGIVTCVRCKTALHAGGETAPEGFRSCPRCGQRQDVRRNSCEKCGVHFIGPEAQVSAVLTGQPLSRAPKGPPEQAVKACAVVAGCFLVFPVALWLLIWLISWGASR